MKKAKKIIGSLLILSMMVTGITGNVYAAQNTSNHYLTYDVISGGTDSYIKTFGSQQSNQDWSNIKYNDSYMYFNLRTVLNENQNQTCYANGVDISTYGYLDQIDRGWTSTDYSTGTFERKRKVYAGIEYLILNWAVEKNNYQPTHVGFKIYNTVTHNIVINAAWSPDSVQESGHAYEYK